MNNNNTAETRITLARSGIKDNLQIANEKRSQPNESRPFLRPWPPPAMAKKHKFRRAPESAPIQPALSNGSAVSKLCAPPIGDGMARSLSKIRSKAN